MNPITSSSMIPVPTGSHNRQGSAPSLVKHAQQKPPAPSSWSQHAPNTNLVNLYKDRFSWYATALRNNKAVPATIKPVAGSKQYLVHAAALGKLAPGDQRIVFQRLSKEWQEVLVALNPKLKALRSSSGASGNHPVASKSFASSSLPQGNSWMRTVMSKLQQAKPQTFSTEERHYMDKTLNQAINQGSLLKHPFFREMIKITRANEQNRLSHRAEFKKHVDGMVLSSLGESMAKGDVLATPLYLELADSVDSTQLERSDERTYCTVLLQTLNDALAQRLILSSDKQDAPVTNGLHEWLAGQHKADPQKFAAEGYMEFFGSLQEIAGVQVGGKVALDLGPTLMNIVRDRPDKDMNPMPAIRRHPQYGQLHNSVAAWEKGGEKFASGTWHTMEVAAQREVGNRWFAIMNKESRQISPMLHKKVRVQDLIAHKIALDMYTNKRLISSDNHGASNVPKMPTEYQTLMQCFKDAPAFFDAFWGETICEAHRAMYSLVSKRSDVCEPLDHPLYHAISRLEYQSPEWFEAADCETFMREIHRFIARNAAAEFKLSGDSLDQASRTMLERVAGAGLQKEFGALLKRSDTPASLKGVDESACVDFLHDSEFLTWVASADPGFRKLIDHYLLRHAQIMKNVTTSLENPETTSESNEQAGIESEADKKQKNVRFSNTSEIRLDGDDAYRTMKYSTGNLGGQDNRNWRKYKQETISKEELRAHPGLVHSPLVSLVKDVKTAPPEKLIEDVRRNPEGTSTQEDS